MPITLFRCSNLYLFIQFGFDCVINHFLICVAFSFWINLVQFASKSVGPKCFVVSLSLKPLFVILLSLIIHILGMCKE